MFIKVNYLGFYPLGSDVEINGIPFMKLQWHAYKNPVFLYGKKTAIKPFYLQLFYVFFKTDIAFFAACEYGLGQYHVFTVNEKQSKKLMKHIVSDEFTYNPTAVYIHKSGNSVYVYDRVVEGARDMNQKIADSFYRLIATVPSGDYTRYTFTNNGEDRFYLDVYHPSLVEETETFILIRKADKIIWHWVSPEIGDICREYRLLDTCVELIETCGEKKDTLYFH